MIGRQSYPALSVSTDKLHFQAAGARKALATKWTTLSTPASLPNMMFGSNASDQSMLNPETPSKSLLGTDTSNSMLFSPPSILKVTNSQRSIYLFLSRLIWILISYNGSSHTSLHHNEVVNSLLSVAGNSTRGGWPEQSSAARQHQHGGGLPHV